MKFYHTFWISDPSKDLDSIPSTFQEQYSKSSLNVVVTILKSETLTETTSSDPIFPKIINVTMGELSSRGKKKIYSTTFK